VSRSEESGLNKVAWKSGSPSLLLKQTSLSAQIKAGLSASGADCFGGLCRENPVQLLNVFLFPKLSEFKKK